MPAAPGGHRGMSGKPDRDRQGAEDAGLEYEHARHQVHRHGAYLDVDGEFEVAFGDGTPQSLLDRLREPAPDPWRGRRDGWQAVHPVWERRPGDEGDG
jgi:hypothetical protein